MLIIMGTKSWYVPVYTPGGTNGGKIVPGGQAGSWKILPVKMKYDPSTDG